MQPRVALYLRVSLDRTGEQLAVARQRDACRKMAEARGWTVVREYVDNSLSAYSAKRPEWEQLLVDAQAGQFDAVMAWALDRFTRNIRDLLRLLDISKATGLRVATVQGGDFDTATPLGRMTAGILALVAQGEVEHKGERQRLANAQRREAGLPPTGRAPVGFKKDGQTHSADAGAVREAYESLLEGRTIRAIARDLNAKGVRTSNGAEWQSYSARKLLTNPRYAALQPDGSTPGAWDPIVPEEVFRAVSAILADPARKPPSSGWHRPHKYLLSSLAVCGVCGELMVAGGTPRTQRTYRCSTAKHLQRVAPPIDDFIRALVIERLSRPDAIDLLAPDDRPDAAPLRTEARTLRARLDALAVEFAEGELTASQLRIVTERLRAKLEDVEARLASAGRRSHLRAIAGAPDVTAVWEAADLEEQRTWVDALMSVVLIRPGMGTRRFDPTTVKVNWKQPT